MSAVALEKIHKTFGPLAVIHDLSLTIPDKSLAVLVGPSGCGKSTLLRIIAGLESMSSGNVLIGDKRVNDLTPAARDIAMVFQSYALYPHKTVAENIGFHLRLKGVPKLERMARTAKLAETIGLSGLLERYPRELSGGQRQRVAMGRAVIREPEVFLFDEPLSNLDASLRSQMRAEIKSLQQRLQTTAIYVTHDQIEAMTLADIIVVMRDGKIEQAGSPLDVYDKPANTFVATFIGSPPMNLLSAVIKRARGGNTAVGAGFAFLLDKSLQKQEGRDVKVGIRPRDFALSNAAGALQGRVELIEPTGDECYVHVAVGNMRFLASILGRPQFHVGDTVGFMPKKGSMHMFDAVTDTRLI
jgi:multiple sugar transport system ATP-binding protein